MRRRRRRRTTVIKSNNPHLADGEKNVIFSGFSINLVVLCPWLCAINSVGPISSSDFLWAHVMTHSCWLHSFSGRCCA